MIKFFRRIRQQLLTENKISKYLLYAVGEIFLVMIGILIALQVNEWNNERNRKKSEQAIIEQLIIDLSKSQYELEKQIEWNLRSARKYAQVLQAFWKTKLPDNITDYAGNGAGSNVYSPILGTAQSLINSGNLELLNSTELKNTIVAYVEAVGYTLKDINRYEESYFRSGVNLLFEAMPGTYRSKAEINKWNESYLNSWSYNKNINARPLIVEKIPFKMDLKQLFEDETFYISQRKLLLYHRNISWKYEVLLSLSNDLLVKLYSASNKHKTLAKKIIDSQYCLVFDTVDLEVLEQADSLLSNKNSWHKNHGDSCDDDISLGNYSLGCALYSASINITGKWDEIQLRPGIRLIKLKILENENRRIIGNEFKDWNNHPDTTFEDVKTLLDDCITIIKKQIHTND